MQHFANRPSIAITPADLSGESHAADSDLVPTRVLPAGHLAEIALLGILCWSPVALLLILAN